MKENNEKLEKFKEISVKSLDAPIFQKLIFVIIRNFNKYRSFPSVYHLLKHRLEWLEIKLSECPPFSWKMEKPGWIENHPIVENFYTSEEASLVYTGKFKSINDARESCYHKLLGNSSRLSLKGAGTRAAVHIVKTKDYFYTKYGNINLIKK